MNQHLFPFVAWMVAAASASADSYVQNPEDRARIESALPAKAQVQPARPRRLLIFTLNVGYGGHPSMAYANEAFSLMGLKTGAFTTAVTNDPNVFEPASLKRFDAVFFNNTVGNCFTNADLRRSLLEFITGGGGLLGVHGTTVAFMNWPGATEDWPEFGYVIGARGANHKDSNEDVWLKLDDADNPILKVFDGQGFHYPDEFFRPQGTYSRNRVRVLLSMDTAKYDPNKGQPRGNCYRADNDYAAAWIRNYGRGRVFYCTIAHNPYVFWDAKMLRFYLAAIQFALGDLPCPTTPSARLSLAVRAQEKLGWRLALAPRATGGSSLSTNAERAAGLGLAYAGGSSAQTVGSDVPKLFNPMLTDAELEKARMILESHGIRLLTQGVAEPPEDESAAARLFEFGRKIGIETFIFERPPGDFAPLEKLSAATGIRVAFPADNPMAALNLATLCQKHGPQFGACLDFSQSGRAGWEPGALVRALSGRLFAVRLPGPDVGLPGLTEKLFAQVQRSGDAPVFLLGSGSAEQTAQLVELFNNAVLKLSPAEKASGPPAANAP